jgi:Cu/Ag efflux protein CusF
LAADSDIVEETGAQGIFFGHGVVKAIQPGTGALTLDHGDIKGCMPAMEMMFRVERPVVSRNLHPGDAIDFTIDGGKYVILDATVVGRWK